MTNISSYEYGVNAIGQRTGVKKSGTAYPVPSHLAANSTLVWDGENRLVSVTVNGNTTSYLYDAQGRRISKDIGDTQLIYVYDGWNPVAQYGIGASHPSVERRYTWGTDLSGALQGAGGVGGLLAIFIHEGSANSYFPTYDGNGNVSEYLDGTGAIDAHFEYDPFGRTTVENGNAGRFDIRFSTKPRDSETGLYYYGYRYYDPQTGRWPSRDPIEEEGGINLYGFVGNGGVNQIDVLGLYKLNPDNFNGPTGSDLAKLESSLTRVQKKSEDLMIAIDELNQCLAKERPESRPAIDKLLDLKQTYRKIAAAIRGNKELEVEQKKLRHNIAGIMVTYSIPLDPVLQLNIHPSNNWKSLSDRDLDILLMHEISHEAADTEDDNTLDAKDAHFVEKLSANLCGDVVIKSWMTKRVRDCCCPNKYR